MRAFTGPIRPSGGRTPAPDALRQFDPPEGTPGTPQSRWQELVIGHLGLRDWERIEVDAELDVQLVRTRPSGSPPARSRTT